MADPFFLEEIDLQCEFAIRCFGEIATRIENGNRDKVLLAFCHMLLVFAGNVAKILFPLPRAPKERQQRAERLRAALQVDGSSPLSSVEARNYLEHFDERMDRFIGSTEGVLVHRLVAAEEAPEIEIENERKLPASYLQFLNTTTLEFVLFDRRVELKPLYDELLRLQQNAREAEGKWPDARKGEMRA
jgi:hypothetical protein